MVLIFKLYLLRLVFIEVTIPDLPLELYRFDIPEYLIVVLKEVVQLAGLSVLLELLDNLRHAELVVHFDAGEPDLSEFLPELDGVDVLADSHGVSGGPLLAALED